MPKMRRKHRQKIAEAHRGNPLSEEHRRAISEGMARFWESLPRAKKSKLPKQRLPTSRVICVCLRRSVADALTRMVKSMPRKTTVPPVVSLLIRRSLSMHLQPAGRPPAVVYPSPDEPLVTRTIRLDEVGFLELTQLDALLQSETGRSYRNLSHALTTAILEAEKI